MSTGQEAWGPDVAGGACWSYARCRSSRETGSAVSFINPHLRAQSRPPPPGPPVRDARHQSEVPSSWKSEARRVGQRPKGAAWSHAGCRGKAMGRRSRLRPNRSFFTFLLGGLHHVPCPHLGNMTRKALSAVSQNANKI